MHWLGQVEQAQQVAGGAAAFAHGLRGLLVREAKFVHQALDALRFFQRVEVFALDVFNEGHGGGGFVGHFAHEHGHLRQSGQTGCAVAPLARDDFVVRCCGFFACAVCRWQRHGPGLRQLAHEDGLHDALRADAFGQLVQRAFVHAGARLVLAGADFFQRQEHGHASGIGGGFGNEQGVQATAQSFGFFGCHDELEKA